MKHHLLIAGTGRAGTSVLVKYLAELGLNTHVTTSDGAVFWDEDAQAGLKDLVLHGGAGLPYVVKSPWLHEFVDEVLAHPDITIDGVIIPVRNLMEAASSRTVLELQHIHRAHTLLADESKSWETWGTTPGGTIYSLNPLDQARLLAVGFHHLIERLTQAQIPVYLLAFPLFAEDPAYLFSTLNDCLPSSIAYPTAVNAHRVVFDRDKVRINAEISTPDKSERTGKFVVQYPALEDLDNTALRREIKKVRKSSAEIAENSQATQWENETLRQENLTFRNDIKVQKEAIEGYCRQTQSLQETLDRIRESRSWAVTAPLCLGSRMMSYILGKSALYKSQK
ncbi:hypothetical protein HB779_23405 (plasmid) [Phyllobacterium sp. 628]|uniref:hypothetical protein n=1 Tax=Phyllobacterium sp. 628 TaxID=2718938 RepID=UPI0016621E79|nr:hypothetical protein [Phyllobacterium sp. 628]QND54842.1 hypothetical protein HB779_23405 [Phyllobacterium sp. 628]